MKKTYILGIGFDVITKDRAIKKIMRMMNGDKNNLIVTGNPDTVVDCLKDESFRKIISEASMVLADGSGILLASKLQKIKLSERVMGIELVPELFKRMAKTGKTVYMLGAGKGVAELAAEKMRRQFEGLKIIGVHDGYFDAEEEKLILEQIKKLKPDLLLVGLGQPKQEQWIAKHFDLPVKVSIGVGGSFDIFSGTLKRAPRITQILYIEWLYRILTQPRKRLKRGLKLPYFAYLVVKDYMQTKPGKWRQ